MPALLKRWRLPSEAPPGFHEALPDVHPLARQVLYARGLRTAAQVRAFLAGSPDHPNPYDLGQMSALVDRIRRAIRAGETIAVYGDYDADGITGLVILVSVLQSLGAHVRPYIPHRLTEEYGLNREALCSLRQEGVRVVLTVDCGIRSVDEIAFARSLGLDVLVTDHHSIPETLPPAAALVNPKLPSSRYPFRELSGVGVAYRVAQALLRAHRRLQRPGATLPDVDEQTYLDLVALGTVADLVPLIGENRSLVRDGLQRLNATARPGLLALIRAAGLRPGHIDSQDIAFGLAPRLNASGRLDTALRSYELLSTADSTRADALAGELDGMNAERQELTERLCERARQMWRVGPPEPLIIVAEEGFHKGVVGLVASRLTDEFYRPSVVIEVAGDHCRGSARSIHELNITEALGTCADLLDRYGGHAMAAGFSLPTANLAAFQERLLQTVRARLAGIELLPSLSIDAICPLTEATWEAAGALDGLRPFGQGHPVPLLVSRGVRVRNWRTVGRGHLRLQVSDGRAVWDAIAFRQAAALSPLPPILDLAYHLDMHQWDGETRLRLVVKDLRPTESASGTSAHL
ncbi:MAG: single-stranded-DNA-specific exonuclease RecJ [Anaerolineae bacterium]